MCKTKKILREFDLRKSNKTSRQSHCKKCMREYQRQWYKQNKFRYHARYRKNKKQYLAQGKKRYLIRKNYIHQFLEVHPCCDCKNSDIRVLEFDHVRGKKKFDIGSGFYRHSWATVLKEITKCDIRCANCHRIRHNHD